MKEIERCFLDKTWGPGSLPKEGITTYIAVGGIAPHAGYVYSGPCAAHLYKALKEGAPRVDTVVIVGTNHTGFGGDITTTKRFVWATPLGQIDVDEELIDTVSKMYPLDDDPSAHMREHSVEVQLPFLQYVYGNTFKLVPIVVKEIDAQEAREFAKALKEAAEKLERRIVVIASSDLTHHGYMYDYVLFHENIPSRVRELDLTILKKVLELDTKGFLSLIEKYRSTVCGPGAIAIAMEFAKLEGATAKLLQYYNSGELTGEEDAVVGYAAVLFYKPLS